MKHIRAVRAFNRVWGPIGEALEVGRTADAAFDGGEFSGRLHDMLLEGEWYRCLERVGERFGLAGHELRDAVFSQAQEEGYRNWKARGEVE